MVGTVTPGRFVGRLCKRRFDALFFTGSALVIGLALGSTATAQGASAPTSIDATAPAPGPQSNVVATQTSATPTALGEIVVTATRRSEQLSKVPISIAAYSQDALDQLGVRTIDDLSRLTPGVTFSQANPGSGTNIDIRGVSSLVGAATTGIYIDDTPIQIRSLGYFPSNVYPDIFDLDRVEILRGPQGTLFGAGSEGGTVRFITPQPSLTSYSAYGRAELAGTDGGGINYEGGAAVGGPLLDDKIGFRVSAWYRRDAGWIDRVDHTTGATVQSDSNQQDATVLRAAFTLAPASWIKITPSIYYQESHFDNTSLYWANLSSPAHDVYRNGDPLGQPGHDNFVLPTLKAEFEFSGLSLVSMTSYFRRRSTIYLDYSTVVPDVVLGPAAPPFGIPGYTAQTNEFDGQDNITQELRLLPTQGHGRFNWVVGVFYQRARQTSFEGIGGANLDTLFGVPHINAFIGPNVQPGDYALVSENNAVDQQYAVYGNLDYSLTSTIKATVGLRVARQTSDFRNEQGGPFGGGALVATTSSAKATPVTPKFALDYQADRNNLYYVSAAKGYRIGGGDAPVPLPECSADVARVGLTGTPTTYNSDSLWSYEVGAKNRLFGGRMSLDSSAYYIDWSNIQQQVFLPNCDFKYVANLGSLNSEGFDVQAQYELTRALTLGVAVGYNDEHYSNNVYPGATRETGPNSVIVSKNDTIDNPPWDVTATSHYNFTLPGGRPAYFDADYVFRSRNSGTIASSDPNSLSYDPQLPRMSEQNVVDLRLGVKFKRFDLSLFSTNVTNSQALTFSLHDSLTSPLFKDVGIRPRVVGLTLVYR